MVRLIRMLTTLLFLLAAALPLCQAGEAVVDKVTVGVVSEEGSTAPPSRILKRITASVGTVGEHVLIGRKVGDIELNRPAYERVVKEVFDRILVGYSVDKVEIKPGSTTHIAMSLVPWGEVVEDVALELDLGGLSPEAKELIKRDMGDIEEKINNVLVGLPVDAVDWAGGVSKSVIREILAAQLPEFKSNFDITAGRHSIVKMSLVPNYPVVRNVSVTLKSSTIPSLLLWQAKPVVQQSAQILSGLPVAFVERHSDYFTAKLQAEAARHPVAKLYGLKVNSIISAGSDTEVTIYAETDKYKVNIEGYMDMGRRTDNTSARLHAGKYIGAKDELFLEVDFIPSTVTWNFRPGWGHSLSSKTWAGFKYDTSDSLTALWVKQALTPNWSLRVERTPAKGLNEIGVRYKLHEFVSAEYIFTNDDKWLRIVGNL